MAIITISRGVQSGGRELARCLSDQLGYQCLSREVITQCARTYNIMENELYEKLLEAPRVWKKLTQEHRRYLVYIKCALIEVAKQDNIIYHGYAGQLFLQGIRHVLKIRLEAPFESRVLAEMQEYNKDRETALQYIQKSDEERSRWVKFLYGRDWHDPALYDLSINVENMAIPTICEIVAVLVKSTNFKKTDQSTVALSNLSLECEVMAAIASDDKLWQQSVTASAQGSVVTLRGVVKNQGVRNAILDIASKAKGVTECRDQIRLSTDPLPKGVFGHD